MDILGPTLNEGKVGPKVGYLLDNVQQVTPILKSKGTSNFTYISAILAYITPELTTYTPELTLHTPLLVPYTPLLMPYTPLSITLLLQSKDDALLPS